MLPHSVVSEHIHLLLFSNMNRVYAHVLPCYSNTLLSLPHPTIRFID